MKKINLLSISLNTGTYRDFVRTIVDMAKRRQSSYVCVVNVHMLVEAHQNSAFRSIVQNADLAAPDGKPLCWSLRLLYNAWQERVAGMDLLPSLLKEAEDRDVPVYFYGGQQSVLDKAAHFLPKVYPGLRLAGS